MKHSIFSKKTALAIGIAGAITLTGCSDSETGTSQVRVIHASPDAPAVNVGIAGISDTAVANLDYANSSGYATIDAGFRDIAVEAIIPAGNTDVINVNGFNFEVDGRYNIIAVNKTADIEPLVVDESSATPGADEVAISVVHASPDAPAVDVYVTAPDTDITGVDASFSFEFKDSIDVGAVPAGSYDITVTLAGTKDVAYNISDVDLSPFAGSKLMLVAVSTTTDTTTAASLVKLLAATDSAQLVLLDEDTQIGARVVHLSPNADDAAGGDVEVFATSDALLVSPTELIPAFGYTDIVPGSDSYVNVPAGDYVFDVSVDGAGPGTLYTSGSIALEAGSEYSVIASGLVGADPAFDLLLTADNNRSVVTQASIKVVHGAPAAGTVDVYVTPADSFSVAQVEGGQAGEPLLADFEFGDITDYVAVPPGDYDVRIVAAGSVAINIEGLTLAAGSVSTAIARQPNSVGLPDDLNVELLTN